MQHGIMFVTGTQTFCDGLVLDMPPICQTAHMTRRVWKEGAGAGAFVGGVDGLGARKVHRQPTGGV